MKKYLILLIMLIFAIYLQVINFPFFAWDDNTYITENSNINTGFSFKGLVWSFTKGINISHYYHPITWLSHMLDCQLFGLNSGLHHLTSLFVHIANILLLYFALAKLTGEKRKSFFVAALFAVHPINVESVVWIAERKNLLSGFFWFLTIFAYAYYIERPEVKRYLLLILAFIVGLLSKPMVVTLPFVLLLLDYWPLNRFRFGMQDSKPVLFRLVREKLPLFILMILTVAVTYFGMERIGSLTSLETYSLQVRVGNSLVSYSKYIVKAFYPVNFGIHYMHPGNNIPLWQLIVSVLFLSCMISVSLWMLSGRPYVAIGLLWYLGTMMPVIGIVQIWHFAMADRFVYIPLIGVFIIISWGIPDLLKWWKGKKLFLSGFYLSRFYERFTPIIFSIIIMFLALATYIQTSYWKNNIALFKHSLSVDKNNVILHRDLGSLLTDEKKYEEAVYQYKTALKIRPSPQINRSLADTFYKMGQIDNAIKYYKKALDGDPEFAIAHNGMAIALFSKRQYKEAEIHFKKASEIEKQNTDFRVNLANYYQAINDTNKCILNYEEAIKANPTDATLYFDLGNIFLKQGNLIKAMYNFAEAIRIDPNHAESYYGAGIIFVQTKMHEKAEKFFLKALEINPNLTRAKSSLRDLRSIKK